MTMTVDDTSRECRCAPCPGRGNDGHGMTHCAECCFGTGVEAEAGCPEHWPAGDGQSTLRAALLDALGHQAPDHLRPLFANRRLSDQQALAIAEEVEAVVLHLVQERDRLRQQLLDRAEAAEAETERLRVARKALMEAVAREANAYAEQADTMEPGGAVAQSLRYILDEHEAPR